MESPKVPINTICLSKEQYDKLKNENMKCKMFLDSVMNYLEFTSENSNELIVNAERVTEVMKLCYPNTYKERLRVLKQKRARERNLLL